ncbi:hypothetical protein [Tenacibaculum amylolyticum]|uniref:hypothetical protein n=1 Tax=Tenacibaculum amylolyticum TaxID=104269 RepID=UPI003895193F
MLSAELIHEKMLVIIKDFKEGKLNNDEFEKKQFEILKDLEVFLGEDSTIVIDFKNKLLKITEDIIRTKLFISEKRLIEDKLLHIKLKYDLI